MSPRAAALVVVLLGLAPGVLAALADQCAWPPPGGPASHPTSVQVEMAPIVADLDADGSPEIVAISFVDASDDGAGHDGILRILRGSDCAELASTSDVGCVACFGDAACRSLDESADGGVLCPGCGVAVADLDGDGFLEIVGVSEGDATAFGNRRLVVFDHRGAFLRCTESSPERIGGVAAPAIADLDADGTAEILARASAWSSDGPLLWALPATGLGATTAADLDGDGALEVVTGEAAYRADGTLLWRRDDLAIGTPAIADLDLDCVPEVIVSSRNAESVHVLDGLTGTTRASAPIPQGDCPPRADGQGGPPTLADVNGDCVPEIGVAGCRRYALYAWLSGPPEALVLLWDSPTDDQSSRFTGSTIFDLEADGTAEVLYNDQDVLRVYDASSGVVEQQLENSTYTLLELPVVADADGDGRAEIVVAANDYQHGAQAGVRVLHDPAVPWAPAPPLFNQHSFHVTNILPDGRVPAPEEPSWARSNSFRVQGPAIRPDTAPALVGVPSDVSAPCDDLPDAPVVTASGGCGESPVVVLTEEPSGGPCGELRRTWSATDRCSRTTSATQVIDLVDDEPPRILGVPADRVLSCHLTPDDVPPTAEDDCDPTPGVELAEVEELGGCAGARILRRTWTARDACGNSASATQVITFVDDAPPRLTGVPRDAVVACDLVPAPAEPTAVDLCDPDPEVVFSESESPGGCADERVITRTWRATDDCGNVVVARQRLTVVDDTPPVFTGVPADVTVSCHVSLPPGAPTVIDACDADPVVELVEVETPGPCAGARELLRTWTARDACGNQASVSQRVTFVDDAPPRLVGVPADAVVGCDEVPEPASPSAIDLCDPDPEVVFVELRFDGSCPDEYRLERRWTATDDCGNAVTARQRIVVQDDGPPSLVGVPADMVVECGDDIPPADVRAVDGCDGSPTLELVQTRVDGRCPGEYDLTRTWTARDRCGGTTSARQVVHVVDTTPPVIAGLETACLWSPNHWTACFGPEDFHPTVTDSCGGPVTWSFVACASDQPEDDLGDGAFEPDCVVEDGRACVRSERQGTRPEGRRYGLLAVAVDACGNASAPTLVGEIRVPHDQREHEDCLKIRDVGAKGPGRP